jgi:hypothetical protein
MTLYVRVESTNLKYVLRIHPSMVLDVELVLVLNEMQ